MKRIAKLQNCRIRKITKNTWFIKTLRLLPPGSVRRQEGAVGRGGRQWERLLVSGGGHEGDLAASSQASHLGVWSSQLSFFMIMLVLYGYKKLFS